MKIVNPPFSEEKFWGVEDKGSWEKFPVGHTLIFRGVKKEWEQWKICQKGEIPFGVEVSSFKEAIFATNFGAKYLFTFSDKLAQILQRYVDDYLLTSRVILIADSLEKIEEVAKMGIDGIIEKTFYSSLWKNKGE